MPTEPPVWADTVRARLNRLAAPGPATLLSGSDSGEPPPSGIERVPPEDPVARMSQDFGRGHPGRYPRMSSGVEHGLPGRYPTEPLLTVSARRSPEEPGGPVVTVHASALARWAPMDPVVEQGGWGAAGDGWSRAEGSRGADPRRERIEGDVVADGAGFRVADGAGSRVVDRAGFQVPDAAESRDADPGGSWVPDPAGSRVADGAGFRVADDAGSRVVNRAGFRVAEDPGRFRRPSGSREVEGPDDAPDDGFDPLAGTPLLERLRIDPGRRGVRALAAVVLLVAVGAAAVAYWNRPEPTPVAPVRAAGSPSPTAGGTLVVAVTGKVRRPGLVRVAAGSRVADVVDAAGGALPDVDLGALNLARKVTDGELVVVGGPAPVAAGVPGAPAGKVNLNTATTAELDVLPGVGPVTAQRIIEYRTAHGPFADVSGLRHVDGIGDARFEQLKDLVTV